MKKPTLVDVGEAAGVSAITVSRALRSPELVSETMKSKVQAAVDKLGYVPDFAASALASNRTNIIGMLVPSFSNNVFSDLLAGAYDAIEDSKYTIQIGNVRYSPLTEEALIPNFINLKPAGIIVTGIDQTSKARELLKNAPCPVVQVMDLSDDPIDMIVGFSHTEAARGAVEHLIDQGFRRIGFLGARMDPRLQRRMSVYQQVMEKHGLFDPALQITTLSPSSVEIGRYLLNDLLLTAPDCDAVICNNDDLAMGVAFECQRRNIRVPDDLGICGFNDLGTTSQMYPAISSVYTPRFECGKKAVEMIIASESNPHKTEKKVVDVGFGLRIRDSTKRTKTEKD